MKIHFQNVKDNILSVKLDKRNECYNWGIDNAFPSLIETLINQSVTANSCIQKVAKAIYGKSFGDIGKKIINSDGQTLNEVLRIGSREYAKHNNVFFHIGYNAELKINSIKVLPTNTVRVGKSDDLGYSGKFIVYNNWNKQEGKIDTSKFKVYNKFNPLKNVLSSRIEKVGSLLQYKGEILHIKKDTNSIYSLSDLNPVLSESLLEYNSQTFRCRGAEKGFLNTKLMVTQPFQSDYERRLFKNSLNDLQGSENAGNVLLLESGQVSDDLNSQIKLEDLSSEYNDELFKYSDEQARKNIALAFGVPLGLIDVSESSLYGQSGELIKQMKLQLWESREEERDQIEEVFQLLISDFHEPILEDLKIISPYQTEKANE